MISWQMRSPSISINQALRVEVDIMILVKAAEINPGGDMTVLKRRQCAKINGVWNSSTPTKISLLSIFHTQYIGKH